MHVIYYLREEVIFLYTFDRVVGVEHIYFAYKVKIILSYEDLFTAEFFYACLLNTYGRIKCNIYSLG